ncbi:MAG: serine protease [Microcystaceae cyanobacterium]
MVKVLSDSKWGSGIILYQQRNKQTGQFDYLVVTNYHVIETTPPPYNIITFDQQKYPVQQVNIDFGETDLVLLKFSSLKAYQPANLTPAFTEGRLSQTTKVTAVGYPIEQSKGLICLEGKVNALLPESLRDGSQIGISPNIKQGMSGGALLNEKNQVIGIIERGNYPFRGYPRSYPLTNNLPLIVPEKIMLPSSWVIPIETLVANAQQNQISLPLAWQIEPNLAEVNPDNTDNTETSKEPIQPIINQLGNVQAELSINKKNRKEVKFSLSIQRDKEKLPQLEIKPDIVKESMIKPTLKVIDLDNDQEPEIIVDIQYKNESCLYDTLSYIYRFNQENNKYDKLIEHKWENVPFYDLKDIDGDGNLEIKTFDGRFSCTLTEKYDTYQQREMLPLQIWHYSIDSDKLELAQPDDYSLEYKNQMLKLLSYYQTQSNDWSSNQDQLQALLAAYTANKLSIKNDPQILTEVQTMYQFPDQQNYIQDLTKLLQKTEYLNNESNESK